MTEARDSYLRRSRSSTKPKYPKLFADTTNNLAL